MTGLQRRVSGFFGSCLALVVLALSGCAITGGPRPEIVAGADWSGLEPVQVKGMDIAAVRPGADFGAYDRVLLEPIEVEFAPEWEPARPGSHATLSPQDMDDLRKDVAGPLREGFARYVQRDGKYPLVEAPGPGVVRIRLKVVDARLNAPDIRTAGRTEWWAKSFGEMTLVAELVDADSGLLIARFIDRWVDPDGPLERFTRVDNNLAIGHAAEEWAEAIRRHLEVASIRNRMQGAGEGLRRADP